jgi:hypothetical protein
MHCSQARLTAFCVATAIALTHLAAPAVAQFLGSPAGSGDRTLQQLERQYPQLNANQIQICDRNGDGLYDRGERACVNSIASSMANNSR